MGTHVRMRHPRRAYEGPRLPWEAYTAIAKISCKPSVLTCTRAMPKNKVRKSTNVHTRQRHAHLNHICTWRRHPGPGLFATPSYLTEARATRATTPQTGPAPGFRRTIKISDIQMDVCMQINMSCCKFTCACECACSCVVLTFDAYEYRLVHVWMGLRARECTHARMHR